MIRRKAQPGAGGDGSRPRGPDSTGNDRAQGGGDAVFSGTFQGTWGLVLSW